MLGAYLASWQMYWPEWSIGYLWSTLDWISRLDVYALALILIYVIVLVRRASYRYRQASLESRAGRLSARAQRDLMACLSRDAGTLQSVASTAPYLGLAGTCLGILESFRGFGMQKAAAMAMTITYIAASLLTTVAGVLVALSSAASYNYLLWLIARLEKRLGLRDRISSKFPLKEKFSKLPAFPLMAAPSLAVALAAFMIFPSFHGPVGLPVRLLKQVELERSRDSSAPPILIGLSEINAYEEPTIYVNSKPTTWDDLDGSLRNMLQARPQTTVYVEADNDVRWAYIATVVDSARTHSDDVVLLTMASEFGSGPAHEPRHRPRP